MTHTLHPASSTILSTAYDPATQTLEVKFRPGAKAKPGALPPHWRYIGVSPEVRAAMLAAPSIGAFFAAEIKPAYTATRVA